MGKRTKHVHQYMWTKLSKFNWGWKCALDYCEHFLPRNIEDTIDGRMSICFGCLEEFKIDEYAIHDAVKNYVHSQGMPRCHECRLTPEERAHNAVLQEQLDAIGIGEDRLSEEGIARAAQRRQEEIERIKQGTKHPAEEDQIEVYEPDEESHEE